MLSPGSRINEPEVNPRLVDMPSLVIEIAVTVPPLTTIRTLTPNASPFTWTNALGVRVLIVVSGGTVTAISITRLGISTSLGLTSGSFIIDPGDSITVTYTAAPSMVGIPV